MSGLLKRKLVRGLLELLWDSAYENGDPFLGDAADVELAAGWTGEPGLLAETLLTCGGPGRPGFIDPVPDAAFAIHDLWDHAPDYVRKRRQRETERRDLGRRIASDLGASTDLQLPLAALPPFPAASTPADPATSIPPVADRHPAATDRSLTGQSLDTVQTTAAADRRPAPFGAPPSPSPTHPPLLPPPDGGLRPVAVRLPSANAQTPTAVSRSASADLRTPTADRRHPAAADRSATGHRPVAARPVPYALPRRTRRSSAFRQLAELQATGIRDLPPPPIDVPACFDRLASLLPADLPSSAAWAARIRALSGEAAEVEDLLQRLEADMLDSLYPNLPDPARAAVDSDVQALLGRLTHLTPRPPRRRAPAHHPHHPPPPPRAPHPLPLRRRARRPLNPSSKRNRPMPAPPVFFTIKQIAERHPAFTARKLRHWIFYSRERYAWRDGKRELVPGNGFDRVIVTISRRVYIDETALFEWLQSSHP